MPPFATPFSPPKSFKVSVLRDLKGVSRAGLLSASRLIGIKGRARERQHHTGSRVQVTWATARRLLAFGLREKTHRVF